MRASLFISLVCSALVVASCAANPGPPPVAEPEVDVRADAPENNAPVEQTPGRSQINVGIDAINAGFNPHLRADESAFTQSLAALVLPSAFIGDTMNTDLLVSAEPVTPVGEAKQTIRYVLVPAAQWSDGTPVTGADFRYLWENMVSTPGVIGAAGYQEISEVRVLDGGKTVEVDFLHSFPQWKRLFTYMLPSHLFVNDTVPFNQVLISSIPASAGKYMLKSVDRGRGVVTLNRNDRYWGDNPAETDVITFQEVRDRTYQLMRSGGVSYSDVAPDETTVDIGTLMHDTAVRVRDREAQLSLVFNMNSPAITTPEQRKIIADTIDPHLLAKIALGRSSHLSVAEPLARNPQVEEKKLPEEGSGSDYVSTRIDVAADSRDQQAVTLAQALVDTLNNKGFDAALIQGDPQVTQADIFVTWERTGDPLAEVSRYQCDSPSNLSGFCDERADFAFQQYLSGERATAKDKVEQLEKNEVISVPIVTDTRVDILSPKILTPAASLDEWPVFFAAGSIPAAPEWRKN